jgi:hypothetical protein
MMYKITGTLSLVTNYSNIADKCFIDLLSGQEEGEERGGNLINLSSSTRVLQMTSVQVFLVGLHVLFLLELRIRFRTPVKR